MDRNLIQISLKKEREKPRVRGSFREGWSSRAKKWLRRHSPSFVQSLPSYNTGCPHQWHLQALPLWQQNGFRGARPHTSYPSIQGERVLPKSRTLSPSLAWAGIFAHPWIMMWPWRVGECCPSQATLNLRGSILPNLTAQVNSPGETQHTIWRREELGRQLTHVCLLGSFWGLNKAQD